MVTSYWRNLWAALRGRPVEVKFVGKCVHGEAIGKPPSLRERQLWTADDVAVWRSQFMRAARTIVLPPERPICIATLRQMNGFPPLYGKKR